MAVARLFLMVIATDAEAEAEASVYFHYVFSCMGNSTPVLGPPGKLFFANVCDLSLENFPVQPDSVGNY